MVAPRGAPTGDETGCAELPRMRIPFCAIHGVAAWSCAPPRRSVPPRFGSLLSGDAAQAGVPENARASLTPPRGEMLVTTESQLALIWAQASGEPSWMEASLNSGMLPAAVAAVAMIGRPGMGGGGEGMMSFPPMLWQDAATVQSNRMMSGMTTGGAMAPVGVTRLERVTV